MDDGSLMSKAYGTVSADRQNEMSGLELVRGLVDGTLPLNTIAQTLRYDVSEAESGRVVVTAEPGDIHLNPAGTVHGGFAATLLDSCMGLAVQSTLEKGVGQTTLEFKISLVRPITPRTERSKRRASWLTRGRRGLAQPKGGSPTTRGELRRPWHDHMPDLPELTGAINPMMDMDRIACYRAISDARCPFRRAAVRRRQAPPASTPADLPGTPTPEIRERVDHRYPSTAAAQEAGFRPCLRCRPETSPELAFWRGTSNTVSRALALIEAGALDEDDVEGLANRLGVGARQLRRLFHRHVGASPVAVAQTRRVLLAKQLIHETSLSMAERWRMSPAPGRFVETFRELFGRPPAMLRHVRDRGKRQAGSLSVRLAYRPPYDWDAMLSFLGQRAIPGVEKVSNDSCCSAASLLANMAAWSRSRRPTNFVSTSRFGFPTSRRCRRSSRGCDGYSIWPPTPT